MVRSAAQKLVLIHPDSTDHGLELEANEPPPSLTLMDLVDAVGQCADTEEEVLATVTYMIRSGHVQMAHHREEGAELAF